jgi:hypothetical protein
MILNELFESHMSELDIEYQDYKKMEPLAFYSRYKMTPDEWASKNWSLIKSSETVHEGAMKDLYTELADKYRELAPKIEKYKDSYLAGELYDALEEIAARHGAMKEFRSMLDGARSRAHMDYDTNPGGFQNWFWYLPFADEQDIAEGSQRFNKPEPFWVCVNGKKWKRFETYQQARNVHDKLEKKLRAEGSDKKVSLLADLEEGLRDPKDNPCWKGYKPVGTKNKNGRTVPNCVPKE